MQSRAAGDAPRAAIYCRLSEEDADKADPGQDSRSIQNQKSMLVRYAVEQGWQIYNIYSDDDYTGSDRERPQFNRLLEDARRGCFDIVLCKSQSRFTREMELVEKYLHGKFMEWGIRFIAVVDHVDTDDTANKKSRQIIRRARKTAPDAVIAVDALAARSSKRIASTIQIADTGITPGSGVGNHRKALDRETLGVPVVAVGVPLVVYASTIAADALCALGEGEVEEERIAACVQRVVSEKLGEMIVTPREVDALVERMAGVLADGINQALHPRLSRDEIAQMMAQ